MRLEEPRGAEHELGGIDQAGARADAGAGLGDDRKAPDLRQLQRCCRDVAGAVPEHDDGTRWQVVGRCPARCRSDPRGPRGVVVSSRERLGPPRVLVGDQRFTQADVDVDRTRSRAGVPGCGGQHPAGQRAPVGVVSGALGRRTDFGEQPDRVAVQLHLVDALVRPGPAQLGRPVSGEHDQWDGRVGRLEDGGMQVGGRRTGCGDEGHRPAGGLGEAEGEKSRGPLVDAHVQAQQPLGVGAVQGKGERCRSRTRGQHRLAQAPADQLVDEHAGEGGRGVHGSQSVAAAAVSTAWQRRSRSSHQRRRPAFAVAAASSSESGMTDPTSMAPATGSSGERTTSAASRLAVPSPQA